jgi:hypothetical protein
LAAALLDGLSEQPAALTDPVRDLSRGFLIGVIIEIINTLLGEVGSWNLWIFIASLNYGAPVACAGLSS